MLNVYGIPTCSTCRKALKWLDTHQIPYAFIDTKADPPSAATITQWVQALGAKPLRNTSGTSYRALGTEKKTWTDAQWISAFAEDAMLLKRPLFERDDTAIKVGFRGSEQELLEALG